MLDGTAGERKFHISEDWDDAHAIDAIDMGNNLETEVMNLYWQLEKKNPPTFCIVRSQFSSMNVSYRTVKRGTCQALTGGGAG